jgi:hypothetical protein
MTPWVWEVVEIFHCARCFRQTALVRRGETLDGFWRVRLKGSLAAFGTECGPDKRHTCTRTLKMVMDSTRCSGSYRWINQEAWQLASQIQEYNAFVIFRQLHPLRESCPFSVEMGTLGSTAICLYSRFHK